MTARQALSFSHLPGKLLSLILPGEAWLGRTLAGEPLGYGGTEPWKHTQVGVAQVGAVCRRGPEQPIVTGFWDRLSIHIRTCVCVLGRGRAVSWGPGEGYTVVLFLYLLQS